ncbi:ArgK/MeaB family GTPase [Prosthecobacter sp.]
METLASGLLGGDRTALARAITLVESSRESDAQGVEVLFAAIAAAAPAHAFRIGITGAAGAGKSTLIEALGCRLCEAGRRVAVLAVDPSSVAGSGALMGDKTRMQALASHPAAFVRPSPSLGAAGGLGAATADVAHLCEAAGYDIVIIETVGAGQGEVGVRDVADVVLMLADPGAGDGLQAIKRGLLEVVDLILITKADGERLPQAQHTLGEFEAARSLLISGDPPPLLLCSALQEPTLGAVMEQLQTFEEKLRPSTAERRKAQHARQVLRGIAGLAAEWACAHPVVQSSLDGRHHTGVMPAARKAWRELMQSHDGDFQMLGEPEVREPVAGR